MNFAAISPERLPDLLRAMPKTELHMHIEGSLEPELIFALAKRNDVRLRYKSVDELRAAYAFTDLQSFLDIYYAGASVLQQPQDFYDMAWAYFQRAKADNVVHAEIFFDPQTHTARKVAMRTVITGLHRACVDAQAQLGISSSLILCFLAAFVGGRSL
jgi:adenine deaminase